MRLSKRITAILIFVTSYFEAARRATALDLILAIFKFIKYNLLYNHFYQNLLLYAEYYETIFGMLGPCTR